jgi:hypothetical protein
MDTDFTWSRFRCIILSKIALSTLRFAARHAGILFLGSLKVLYLFNLLYKRNGGTAILTVRIWLLRSCIQMDVKRQHSEIFVETIAYL